MNKIIVVLALVVALFTVNSAHAEFVWRHFGAAPYASSRTEAMRTRGSAFRALGFPEQVVARLMKATQEPGTPVRVVNGDRFSAMLSKGGAVDRNVRVDFIKPPVSGKMEYAAPAEQWQVLWRGQIYTVILPKICNNWLSVLPAPSACYLIPFNYSHTAGVAWDKEHRAKVSGHLDASESQLEAVYNNPCFGVRDASGFRKPFHRCEFCDGAEYPPAGLASAVGLPPEEPKGVFSFRLQDGQGYFSLPKAWAARRMVFCVTTKSYPVTVPGYAGWTAVSVFDIITKNEIERTLPAGMLDRVLKGGRSY